jgi:chemotaxis protein CheC
MDEKFSIRQLDIIKELGTIGAGRAATALADLIDIKVDISVPQATVVPLENISSMLGPPENPFFVLDIHLAGDIAGRIFLLFSPDDTKIITGMLLKKQPEEIKFDDPMVQSSLMECSNILSGSYITVLAEMTGLNIIFSTPSLAMDMLGAILDFIFIQIAQESDQTFFIKTELKVKEKNLEGILLFFPDTQSFTKIFEALKIDL